jgi:hypothetical protein
MAVLHSYEVRHHKLDEDLLLFWFAQVLTAFSWGIIAT